MKNNTYISSQLTEKTLIKLGFEHTDKDRLDRNVYRLKVPNYYFQIQVVLGDYPASNPNCGIVSIYSPEEMVSAIPKDLYKKEKWTIKDKKRAKNYKIKFPELIQPIAWYVNTNKRLRAIISSLTNIKTYNKK